MSGQDGPSRIEHQKVAQFRGLLPTTYQVGGGDGNSNITVLITFAEVVNQVAAISNRC